MANPDRTDYAGPPLSGPGILWINSRVRDVGTLSVDAFHKWYETIHIPDIIAAKPGGIVTSWRYESTSKGRRFPYLAVYNVPDMSFLESAEFKAIPMTHPTLPENGPIHKFAEFDSRFMGHVETWKSMDARNGRTGFLVSEAIEPDDATAETFHEWFRSQYIAEISRMAGWQRTSLLKLMFKKQDKNDPDTGKDITPSWIALHEFQPGSIAGHTKLTTLLGKSESANNVARQAKKLDVAAFQGTTSFGEVDGKWADVFEKVLQ